MCLCVLVCMYPCMLLIFTWWCFSHDQSLVCTCSNGLTLQAGRNQSMIGKAIHQSIRIDTCWLIGIDWYRPIDDQSIITQKYSGIIDCHRVGFKTFSWSNSLLHCLISWIVMSSQDFTVILFFETRNFNKMLYAVNSYKTTFNLFLPVALGFLTDLCRHTDKME